MAFGRHRSVGIRLTDHGASFVELESLMGRVRVLDAGLLELDREGEAECSATEGSGKPRSGRGRPRFAKADQVILGLPRHAVICRFIDVPNVEDDQLEGLLSFEIDRHVPFPVEEACFSYRKVSSNGAMATVLIMAAKRTDVEEAVARVRRLGIVPTGVDISSLAAITALHHVQRIPAGQMVTLVQVEADEATVEVFSRDALVSSRTVSLYGGVENSSDGGGCTGARLQKKQRIAANGYLAFSSDVLVGEGQVVDLSGQGMCVTSDDPVVPGMVLRLSMLFPDENDPLEIDAARVQWVGPSLFGLNIQTGHQDGCLDPQRFVMPAMNGGEVFPSDVPRVLSLGGPMRSPVEGYVIFSGVDGEGEGTAVELSAGGWRIQSATPVSLGTMLTIQAAFPELNDPIVMTQGRVQWTGDGEFGVQALVVEKESLDRIASYLAFVCPVNTGSVNGTIPAESLVNELTRVAALREGPADPILLHGAPDSLCRNLREELGRPVDRWDATPVAADPAAFGLALRGLPRYAVPGNLLPPECRVVRKDPVMMLCGSLLALLGCLTGLWWASDAFLERRVHNQLKTEIQQVRQEASAVTALQQEASALNQRLKALEGLMSVQGRSMHLLREVVTLLPPDVLLQELSFDGAKVRVRGSTTASAALLISAFEQSAYLENAAFTAPISVQGKDRQAFEIAATIRAVPRPPVEHREKGAS